MLKQSEIERIKLTANALDRLSTSSVTVGVATPLAGLIYNVAGFGGSIDLWRMVLGLAGWLLAGSALHYAARRTLGVLDVPEPN